VAGLGIETVASRLVWFLLAIIVGLFLVVFVAPLSMWLPTALGLVG
jgi:TRAP-type C4-dicarboxylate transport system permease large subunit